MIGNLLNILLGLWLAYSAIFANPAGAMNNVALAAAAVAVIVFAVWARQTDFLGWPSGTNIVLAAVLLVLAGLRWANWSAGSVFTTSDSPSHPRRAVITP